MTARLIALVPAAGRGERFGPGRSKMFVEIDGKPVLAWSLERLLAAGVDEIRVALPAPLLAAGFSAPVDDPRLGWTAGGDTRQHSVAAALAAAPGAPDDLILVHDGARPAISPRDARAVAEAARQSGAAVLGRPVADTLKEVDGERIVHTVDRSRLFRAETPQVFRRALFDRALELARRDGFEGTDDASLVERLPGVDIRAVPARYPNPKLTEPADLALLGLLLGRRAEPEEDR